MSDYINLLFANNKRIGVTGYGAQILIDENDPQKLAGTVVAFYPDTGSNLLEVCYPPDYNGD